MRGRQIPLPFGRCRVVSGIKTLALPKQGNVNPFIDDAMLVIRIEDF